MLEEGSQLPEITLPNAEGKMVGLRELGNAVIYFYPKSMTPGCTKEACSFRDSYGEIRKRGYRVIGISTDPVERQKEFVQKEDLNFELLADPEKKAVEAFGVEGRFGTAERKTFIIRDGRIARTMDGGTSGHGENVLKAIDELEAEG